MKDKCIERRAKIEKYQKNEIKEREERKGEREAEQQRHRNT